jgi:MinD-like ATPase involved in chromosome partitioning or flagellar assembly
VAHLELLTPDEAEFLGVRGGGDPRIIDDLPLWPEALAKGQARELPVLYLPSHSFTPLSPPVVATFYSLRGGVGRSTALVHTARLLAAQGLGVLCVDMDLEAPGLASLFAVEDQVAQGQGVVSLLLQTEVAGAVPDLESHIIRVSEATDLRLLPAGLPTAEYARQLNLLEPSAWYREDINPLRLLIAAIERLSRPPHVVLIDSRTGISPLAAPLLFDVSDIAVVTFYPHPQARQGTRALTRALLGARTRRSRQDAPVSPEMRFIVSPVPAVPEVVTLYSDRAVGWIGEWLAPARDSAGEPVFEALEDIIQVVGYRESIATSDTAVGTGPSEEFEPVAAWIAGLVEPDSADIDSGSGEPREPSKADVLQSLGFAAETAELQDKEELLGTFLSTADVERALSSKTTVVIGRKGTGKTAILRKLAAEAGAVVVTSPPGTDIHRPWTPDSNFYSSVSRELASGWLEWRQIWPAIIGLTLLQYAPGVPAPSWLDGPVPSSVKSYRKSDLLRDLRSLLAHPDAPVLVTEWLLHVDESLAAAHLLLFDALDTGFGNSAEDRRRRTESVAGLMTAISSIEPQLKHLKFKVLLREDIWRDIAFPNKSHLEAQAARLAWSNKTDYLRIAIKQAWRSGPFQRLVSNRLERGTFDLDTPIEYWPEAFVRATWVILAGDRISGGRTAYTDNWVWARLADANGDHSPRALAQLLGAASGRERSFERANPYPRSILRPRALVDSLDDVSERALDALRRDEFPELEPLFVELESVGATPFDADQLAPVSNLVPLGREVGLLEPVIGPRDSGERIRVPELYRKALGMTRRGQA